MLAKRLWPVSLGASGLVLSLGYWKLVPLEVSVGCWWFCDVTFACVCLFWIFGYAWAWGQLSEVVRTAEGHRRRDEAAFCVRGVRENMYSLITMLILRTARMLGVTVRLTLLVAGGEADPWFIWITRMLEMIEAYASSVDTLVISGVFTGHARSIHDRFQEERIRKTVRSILVADLKFKSNKAWQAKTEELAGRGFTIEALLGFYKGISGRFDRYDPSRHTTHDIVRQVIIPMTAVRGTSLAEMLMDGQPTTPTRFLTHNWGNLFRDLVAVIIADALHEVEYAMIAFLMDNDIGALEELLRSSNRLNLTYWVCAISVNQHRAICHEVWGDCRDPVTNEKHRTCSCGLKKYTCDTPPVTHQGESIECEMNKFHCMMELLASRDSDFRQVVAVDRECTLFSRAWCVAEVAAAHGICMRQKLVFHSAEVLEHSERLRTLRIQDMSASYPGDKAAILSRIEDHEVFNRQMRFLLFNTFLPAWQAVNKDELMQRAAAVIRWEMMLRKARSSPSGAEASTEARA